MGGWQTNRSSSTNECGIWLHYNLLENSCCLGCNESRPHQADYPRRSLPVSPPIYNSKDKEFTGWPPRSEDGKSIGVYSDRWVWLAKDLPARVKGTRYKNTYVTKGSVRTNVGGNGDPVIIRNELTGKFHSPTRMIRSTLRVRTALETFLVYLRQVLSHLRRVIIPQRSLEGQNRNSLAMKRR